MNEIKALIGIVITMILIVLMFLVGFSNEKYKCEKYWEGLEEVWICEKFKGKLLNK